MTQNLVDALIDTIAAPFRTLADALSPAPTQRDFALWPPAAEVRRVAVEQEHPRLNIFKMGDRGCCWVWEVTDPTGEVLDTFASSTWAESLAIGLAALAEYRPAGVQ